MEDHLQRYKSKPGKVPCMSCGEKFESEDRLRIRRCPKCKSGIKRFGLLAEKDLTVPRELEAEE